MYRISIWQYINICNMYNLLYTIDMKIRCVRRMNSVYMRHFEKSVKKHPEHFEKSVEICLSQGQQKEQNELLLLVWRPNMPWAF